MQSQYYLEIFLHQLRFSIVLLFLIVGFVLVILYVISSINIFYFIFFAYSAFAVATVALSLSDLGFLSRFSLHLLYLLLVFHWMVYITRSAVLAYMLHSLAVLYVCVFLCYYSQIQFNYGRNHNLKISQIHL